MALKSLSKTLGTAFLAVLVGHTPALASCYARFGETTAPKTIQDRDLALNVEKSPLYTAFQTLEAVSKALVRNVSVSKTETVVSTLGRYRHLVDRVLISYDQDCLNRKMTGFSIEADYYQVADFDITTPMGCDGKLYGLVKSLNEISDILSSYGDLLAAEKSFDSGDFLDWYFNHVVRFAGVVQRDVTGRRRAGMLSFHFLLKSVVVAAQARRAELVEPLLPLLAEEVRSFPSSALRAGVATPEMAARWFRICMTTPEDTSSLGATYSDDDKSYCGLGGVATEFSDRLIRLLELSVALDRLGFDAGQVIGVDFWNSLIQEYAGDNAQSHFEELRGLSCRYDDAYKIVLYLNLLAAERSRQQQDGLQQVGAGSLAGVIGVLEDLSAWRGHLSDRRLLIDTMTYWRFALSTYTASGAEDADWAAFIASEIDGMQAGLEAGN